MKAFLLYRDRDFHWLRPPSTFRKASSSIPLPPLAQALVQDLELNTLFGAMAGGDQFLFEVAESAVLSPLDDPSTIVYRQEILRDCLDHYDVVLELYNRTVGCLAEARRPWSGSSPRSLVFSSVTLLELFVATLRSFRAITDAHASEFRSEGFTRFFGMLSSELDDDYFEEIEQHLRTLRFNTGMLISARLGEGNKGIDYVVRRLSETKKSWLRRLAVWESDPYSFDVSPRDEAGARALGELQGRGINPVANAVAQSADHIRSFLTMLQIELAFYLGCVNLHRRLAEKREPTCYPEPMAAGKPVLSASGLYDACPASSVTSAWWATTWAPTARPS